VVVHALRGDSIVLVSGTLAPLAEIVKRCNASFLARRGNEIGPRHASGDSMED
jgi:hypothetical protein